MRHTHRPGPAGRRPEVPALRSRRPPRSVLAAVLGVLTVAAIPAGPVGGQEAPGALAEAVQGMITAGSLADHARAIVEHVRPSGSPGEFAAIDHVVESLRAEGVAVEVHRFPAYASDPVSARIRVPGADLAPEAITVSFSASVEELEAPLVDVGALDDLPDLEPGTGERLTLAGGAEAAGRGLPDVEGKIVLVTGLPRNVPVTVLDRLGAVGVIFANPEERLNELIVTSTWGVPSLLNEHRLPTLPVAEVKKSGADALRELLDRGPVTVRMTTETDTGWKSFRLAVARIPGPSAGAPYVLFGGHIDGWHHGATDEGASNAAMVELARAFHAHRDRLRRGLVVAWWPGHSNARYAGSTWYADRFFDQLRRRAVAYVNVDGIGQRGAERFGAAATASLAGLARRVVREGEGAEIDPFRPGRNSDQSFNGIGLPLLQLYHNRLEEDGGYWWWHTTEDTFDKIDPEILKRDTDLYAAALASLLAAPVLPLEMTAQVEQLRSALAMHEERSGGRLDLSEPRERLERLAGAVADAEAALEGADGGPGLDADLLALHRTLHRILYVPHTPYHPDSGVAWTLLPGLAASSILDEAEPGTDRYRFARTGLLRERNRIMEALARATGRAEALAAALSEGP